MKKNITLEEAKELIKKLEKENKEMKKELEEFRSRDWGGRRKHDATWQKSYNSFVELYEQGLSMHEIVAQVPYSQRTCYRYKSYYDELNNAGKKKKKK